MSELVARKLAASLRPTSSSVFKRDSLVSTAAKLRANPWVAELREVRRVYGSAPGDTLLVDCDFRSPLALVKAGKDYWFVDAHAVKLPEKFAEAELPAVVFSAVRHHAPPRDRRRSATPRRESPDRFGRGRTPLAAGLRWLARPVTDSPLRRKS